MDLRVKSIHRFVDFVYFAILTLVTIVGAIYAYFWMRQPLTAVIVLALGILLSPREKSLGYDGSGEHAGSYDSFVAIVQVYLYLPLGFYWYELCGDHVTGLAAILLGTLSLLMRMLP